jgi:preprotein translocase subunit SecF
MEFFKKPPQIRFMENRRWFYAGSLIMVVASIVLLATRGLNFGIDFTGGVVVEVGYPQAAELDRARETLAKAGYPDAQVQAIGATGQELLIRVGPREDKNINAVGRDIAAALQRADPGAELRRTDVVGAQVGKDLTEQGGLALLFTFLLILIYVGFRFEKKMAAATVIAAMHDPLIILGFFSATQLTFDLSVLAAVLAVIGYSINDTVVVFDRVRETFPMMRKAPPAQVINTAVNATLSRTLITSFSTLFVVGALYLFGGEALKGFSVAIIVGVVVGTYSSIFIASALALDMKLNILDILPPVKDKDEVDAMP